MPSEGNLARAWGLGNMVASGQQVGLLFPAVCTIAFSGPILPGGLHSNFCLEPFLSIAAIKWAFDLPLQDLPAKAVLIALADHYSEQNECCWPSVERLQKFTGGTRRTIQRAIARLIAQGYVTRHERTGNSSIFELSLPLPTEVQRGASERRPHPVTAPRRGRQRDAGERQRDAQTIKEPLPKPKLNQMRSAPRVVDARGAQEVMKALKALATRGNA